MRSFGFFMLNLNKEIELSLIKKIKVRTKSDRSHKINLKEFNKKYKNFLKIKYKFLKKNSLRKIELFEVNRYLDFKDRNILFFYKNKIYKDKISQALKIKNSIYMKYLKKFSKGNIRIIEFGCGYGNNIFEILNHNQLKKKFLIGLDISKSGIKFLNFFIKKKKLSHKISTGTIDIYNNRLKKNLPTNSLIFTSFAMHYQKRLNLSVMNIFLKCKPKFVVHFEPIYDHCNEGKIDKLRRSYFQKNNYTINFLKILKYLEKKKKIKILVNKPKLFGINILLPFSLIVWKPVY